MKKKIVIHSNHSRAFTGFGKHTKNILQYLYQTDKYEIVEFANGLAWDAKETKLLPWKCYGSLPSDPQRINNCLLYTSPSPRDATLSRMPSSA